jgi:hypothetical protein
MDTNAPETKEKVQGIMIAIRFIWHSIKSIGGEWMIAGWKANMSWVAFVTLLGAIGLSVAYLIMLIVDVVENKIISNPLNKDSLDYKVAQASKGTTSKYRAYKYKLFVVFPVVIILASGIGIWGYIKSPNRCKLTVTVVIACISMFFGLLTAAGNIPIYVTAVKPIENVAGRIEMYNNYVLDRMFKDVRFMTALSEPPAMSFDVPSTIKSALKNVDISQFSSDDLAKLIFTIYMYYHYQKLGIRNPEMQNALRDTFHPTSMLSPKSYTPSDYLWRKSNYIEEKVEPVSNMIQAINLETNQDWKLPSDKIISDAFSTASTWIATINNLANTIFDDSAMSSFLRMAAIITTVQILPIIVFVWIWKNENLRNAILGVLNRENKISNE